MGLFDYEGPPALLAAIRAALAAVPDPVARGSVLAAGRVRQVRVQGREVQVLLALPPGGLAQVVREDAQAELVDPRAGAFSVQVDGTGRCAARCRAGPACPWPG